MDKRFWLILGGIIALLIGIFVITGGKADNSGSDFAGEPTEIQDDDRIVNPDASRSVVLIEYGDFECPGCGALHPVLKQMHEEFANSVTFVFRHFPLTTIHRNAFAAHRAAEAPAAKASSSLCTTCCLKTKKPGTDRPLLMPKA